MALKHVDSGVEIVENENLEDHPYCEHGPTLLFERFFKDRPSQRFYACSACRDRKQCTFFQLETDKMTNGKKLIQKEIKSKLAKRKPKMLKKGDNWCIDCGVGLESLNKHKDHNTWTLDNLSTPSLLLNPKDNKKSNAQYFFDDSVCQLFASLIKRMAYKKVLCVGTPRLHEYITNEMDVPSLLLDIDSRFGYFYDAKKFVNYNMFNGYCFDGGAAQGVLTSYLNGEQKVLIIVDPPFGGLVSLISKMLHKFWKICGSQTHSVFVYPYFLESQVNQHLPMLKMSDYKVGYTNHARFNNITSERGSPVRLYTNIPLESVTLPKEGYRFCKLCNRYVYNGNLHCKKCEKCPSKDGRPYIHCDDCNVCVKPGLSHCDTCNRCSPTTHSCQKSELKCRQCGEMGHKKIECPAQKKIETVQPKSGEKRKAVKKKNTDSKKKKSIRL